MLGSAGPAQAAIYAGSWDPGYGAPFPDLGWNAHALFDVPAGCAALGTASNVPTNTGDCAGFSVLSAEVNFYDISDPSTILESFNLDPGVIVNGIDLTAGALTGIDTGFFDFFVPTLSIAGGGDYSFSLVLFNATKAQLIYALPPETSPTCANPFTPVDGAMCGVSADAATGVFTAVVPEPETYALMLAGLGAIGLAARRRRR
jgi:hypothetical protein